jgi:hypothetical protein
MAVAHRVTAVAQWAKAPGIHCYVAGSIPAVTPRYCPKKIEKCSLEHKRKQKQKNVPETASLYSAVTHHTRDSLLRPGSFNLDLIGRLLLVSSEV